MPTAARRPSEGRSVADFSRPKSGLWCRPLLASSPTPLPQAHGLLRSSGENQALPASEPCPCLPPLILRSQLRPLLRGFPHFCATACPLGQSLPTFGGTCLFLLSRPQVPGGWAPKPVPGPRCSINQSFLTWGWGRRGSRRDRAAHRLAKYLFQRRYLGLHSYQALV